MSRKTEYFVDVDAMVVRKTVGTSVDETSEQITQTWELDFSGCTTEQLLTYATSDRVISLQGRYRGKPFGDDGDVIRFDVAKECKPRVRLTKLEKIARELEGASAEQFEQIKAWIASQTK